MTEYEVLIQTVNPCGGDRHGENKIMEIETDDPMAWAKENSPFPVIDQSRNASGDLVIRTSNDKGYKITYTFTE